MNKPVVDLPLRDIHLPAPISWWPPAIGWWIALGVILIFLLVMAYFVMKYLQPTLKKNAARTLDAIEKAYLESGNAAECLTELSAFLRRFVISQENSKNAAGLTGRAWLEFLDKPLDKPEFSQGIGQVLLSGPYQPESENIEVNQLIQLCRKWVQRYD